MKKTDTWALRFTVPTQVSYRKELSSTTYDVHSGETRTLLKDGKMVPRLPLKDKEGNEIEPRMPIPIMGEIYLKETDRNGRTSQNRYMQQTYEVAKDGFTEKDFDRDQWAMLQRNRAIIEYAKRHVAVSWKNSKGEEQNRNVLKTAKPTYLLINMDAVQDEQAAFEVKKNKLMAELIAIKEDPEEFMNVAYGMNINPAGLNTNEVFNVLCKIVEKNPVSFERFLEDQDRLYKIVISKAQRMKNEVGENFLLKDETNNYLMNGTVIAHGENALISFFKDRPESFDALQANLGTKKKMTNQKAA